MWHRQVNHCLILRTQRPPGTLRVRTAAALVESAHLGAR